MTIIRSIQRSVPLATLLFVSAAPIAHAQLGRVATVQPPSQPSALPSAMPSASRQMQQRQLFEWTGAVDREKQITMRGDRVYTTDIGNTEPRLDRARPSSSIPRTEGRVVVKVLAGRGSAQVIEQPSARNNYSTVIRVADSKSGSSNYRLIAYWEGYETPVVNRGRDDDHRRDNDNWDRGRGPNVGAGRRDVLHWSGNVDDELEIRLQNGRVSYRTLRGSQPTGIRSATGNAADSRNDQFSVNRNQGRGTIVIVQQPNARNGFTTIIRVKDPQSGYGHYEFDIIAH